MASKFTDLESLPAELEDQVWDEMIAPPGIHFYRYMSHTHYRGYPLHSLKWRKPSTLIGPAHFDPNEQQEPYNKDSTFFGTGCQMVTPTGDFIQHAESFGAVNRPGEDPSSYRTVEAVRAVSTTAGAAVDRWASRGPAIKIHGPTLPVQMGASYCHFKEKTFRPEQDIFCIQMGHDDEGRHLPPFDPRLYSAGHGELSRLRKLAFEWRPWCFRKHKISIPSQFDIAENNELDISARKGTLCRGYYHCAMWRERLWEQCPELETVYLIDYSISLKKGQRPDTTAEVFQGFKYKFVEVKPGDDAFQQPRNRTNQESSHAVGRWVEEHNRLEKAEYEGINYVPETPWNSPIGWMTIFDPDGNPLPWNEIQNEPWVSALIQEQMGPNPCKDYPAPFTVKVLACIKDAAP